jgi:predicted TIM-barrel enzyme
MLREGTLFRILLVLVLVVAILALAGCGQEEGKEAREIVDEAGRNATDFAEGFCGAIILAPLCLGIALTWRRRDS